MADFSKYCNNENANIDCRKVLINLLSMLCEHYILNRRPISLFDFKKENIGHFFNSYFVLFPLAD